MWPGKTMNVNFRTDNMVMIGTLSTGIKNLKQVYECLNIHYIDYIVGTKLLGMGRETVPFFGHNGVIIGLKYGTGCRGILRTKGHLPNLIGVDLQCFDKNINVKISHDSMQLAGAKSEEMGNGAFQLIINHFIMTQNNFNHVFALSDDVKIGLKNWIIFNCGFVSVNPDNTTSYLVKSLEECLKALEHLPDYFDPVAATYLLMFSAEYSDLSDYSAKLDLLFSFTEPIFLEVPELTHTKVCNGVYSYSLGKQLSLIKLSQMLSELKSETGAPKYGVSFHNWSARKQVKLALPIEAGSTTPHSEFGDEDQSSSEDQPDVKTHTKKMPAHRFTISQKGSIKQYSPTPYFNAHRQFSILITDLQGYETAAAQVTAQSEG